MSKRTNAKKNQKRIFLNKVFTDRALLRNKIRNLFLEGEDEVQIQISGEVYKEYIFSANMADECLIEGQALQSDYYVCYEEGECVTETYFPSYLSFREVSSILKNFPVYMF